MSITTPPTPPPAIDYLHPETLAQVESIELRARMVVEGVMSGMHRSPYQGYSVEFAQHRQYVPGDDIKHMDWKVYGRTDKLYIKQYQQETTLDLMIMVDVSGSMDYGSQLPRPSQIAKQQAAQGRIWRKIDHATVLAAALSYIALKQQDRVGLVIFADRILDVVKLSNARGQWRAIVDSLNAQPVDKPTHMGRVFDEVLGMTRQRSLFVCLSDMFDDDSSLNASMARIFHRQHDLMLMQLLDYEELNFEFSRPTRFLGLEEEGQLDLDPKSLRTGYIEEVKNHIESIASQARRFHFEHEVVDTSMHIGPPLGHFLARRTARMKSR